MKYITPSDATALVLLHSLPASKKKAVFGQLMHSRFNLSAATKRAARGIVRRGKAKKK